MTDGNKARIGVIGGSGVYEIDGLSDTRWIESISPYGAPSDALLHGRLGASQFVPANGTRVG